MENPRWPEMSRLSDWDRILDNLQSSLRDWVFSRISSQDYVLG